MFGVLRPPSPPESRLPVIEDESPLPQSLAPMPSREFPTREELLTATKDWAASQGYAIVIARSRANRLWLKCDRGGNYENRRNLTDELRKRKRGESRLLGCPFRMIAMVKRDGSWKIETHTPEHNHGPSDDLSLHPTLRRMTEAQLARVHEMFDAGKSPAETVEELKATWPDIKLLTRDIYNARKKYKTQKEETEAAEGLERRPVPDPNGVIPGPDENGRWAWVPDGEEVTNKQTRSRRKKNTKLAASTPRVVSPLREAMDETLDPQLQRLSPVHQQPPNARTLPSLEALMNPLEPHNGAISYDSRYQAPHRDSREDRTPVRGLDDSSHSARPSISDTGRESPIQVPVIENIHISPGREYNNGGRESPVHAPVIENIHIPPGLGPNNADSPVVLAARIQRMEKEQQDTKNMLAQILGAVKGMSGSPPS